MTDTETVPSSCLQDSAPPPNLTTLNPENLSAECRHSVPQRNAACEFAPRSIEQQNNVNTEVKQRITSLQHSAITAVKREEGFHKSVSLVCTFSDYYQLLKRTSKKTYWRQFLSQARMQTRAAALRHRLNLYFFLATLFRQQVFASKLFTSSSVSKLMRSDLL